MIEFELRVIEYFQDQWQNICRTMEPKEILAHIAALTVVVIFLIILTFYQPVLMGIAISLTLLGGAGAGIAMLGHHRLKDWVTDQCETAKHAERVREMERRTPCEPVIPQNTIVREGDVRRV
jgi:hypothetical protein